jgi:hypothetical protein
MGADKGKLEEKFSFISDMIDIVCYLCKSETFILKFAKSEKLFELIWQNYKLLPKTLARYPGLVYSLVELGNTFTYDRERDNFEIAAGKYGCDMEGFAKLDEVKQKVEGGGSLRSKYNKAYIRESNIDLKLYKNLQIYNIISDYFEKNLKNTSFQLTQKQQMTMLNQMEFIAGNRNCRSGFFNKHIFEFLRLIYNQKDEYGANTDPEMIRVRERLFSFISKISALCVPDSLTYNMKYFVVDMLVSCVEKTTSELSHFEAVLGLTQFSSSDSQLALKLYSGYRIMGLLMSTICDENPHVGNAGYELLSNIVMCDKVLEDIHEGLGMRSHLTKAFNVANLYLDGNRRVGGGPITQLVHENITHKFPTCINILCIVCCVPGLAKELMLEFEWENVVAFLRVIEDRAVIDALAFKFKYVMENMQEATVDGNKENSGPVLKEVTGTVKLLGDKEVLAKFKGSEAVLDQFLGFCKN